MLALESRCCELLLDEPDGFLMLRVCSDRPLLPLLLRGKDARGNGCGPSEPRQLAGAARSKAQRGKARSGYAAQDALG